MPKDTRFAVLIDADNISQKYLKIILDEIAKDGIATYKRIYGDWTSPNLGSWKGALLDNSILPYQQYSYTTGKNATDSAMIIDAMDILYSGQVEGFCLVSSDSDFTRLAARLRESGMTVVGMGERKTPTAFISACNRFKYLDILAATEEEPTEEVLITTEPVSKTQKVAKIEKKQSIRKTRTKAKEEEPQTSLSLETIKRALHAIVEENSDEDDWMFIGKMANILIKRYPDFDVRNFGFSKLLRFIESLEIFEIENMKKGDSQSNQVYVRLK